MRVAAIDVGTNSIHLLVSDILPDGTVRLVERARSQVMLGSGGLSEAELTPAAIQRGMNALHEFRAACDSLEVDHIHAAATSAVREAKNGAAFCQDVKRETGIHVRVIAGREEARLIYLGARHDLDYSRGRVLLVDIGGGSTEFVLSNPDGPLHLHSLPLGHIRLTDQYRAAPSLSLDERQAIKRVVRQNLKPLLRRVRREDVGAVVGTSGTIRCLSRMATLMRGEQLPEHNQGLVMTRKEVENIIQRFIDLPPERVLELPGMDPKRRQTLPAGAILIREIMKALDISRLTTSDRSLRDGLIADWIIRHRPELELSRTVSDPRRRSVLLTMQRFNVDEAHANQVAKLAVSLFRQTERYHELPVTDLELLRASAMLHDVGHHIAGKRHHKHGQYILKNIRLYGFTAPEVAIMSNLVRYHSRSSPKSHHPDFMALTPRDRTRVRVMAGLLQVADAFDRSHNQPIEQLKVHEVEQSLCIEPVCRDGADLERWSASHRSALLQSALGLPIRIMPADGVAG